MGRYLAGRVRPSTLWNSPTEMIVALNLPSSLPSFLLSLYSLSSFPLALSVFPVFLFFFFFTLPSPSPSLVLSRSFEQRASRSRVGHTPVRVKVSSVLASLRPSHPFFSRRRHLRDDHHLPRHSTDAVSSNDTRCLCSSITGPRHKFPSANDSVPSCRVSPFCAARRFLSMNFFFLRDAERPRPRRTFPIVIARV